MRPRDDRRLRRAPPSPAPLSATPLSATAYGPLIDHPGQGYASLNIPGCIELTQGNTLCSAPVGLHVECTEAACSACAVNISDPNGLDALNASESAADTGACAPYVQAAKCAPTTGPCVETSFEQGYSQIVPLFCLAP